MTTEDIIVKAQAKIFGRKYNKLKQMCEVIVQKTCCGDDELLLWTVKHLHLSYKEDKRMIRLINKLNMI